MKVIIIILSVFLSTITVSNTAHTKKISKPLKAHDIYILAIGSCPPWQSIKNVCRNDVNLFVSTAVNIMDIPIENIKTIIDSESTYDGVVDGFDWLKEKSTSDSAVIVYYNGHGALLPNNTSGRKNNKDEVFILWSEKFPFAGLYAVMANIWMTDKEFSSLLGMVPGRAKVVIADTCHAGESDQDLSTKGKHIDYGLKDSALLAAAEAGELAYVDRDFGLFTLELTEAMYDSANLKNAFLKARQNTLIQSKYICREIKEKNSKYNCKEQRPTMDDPHKILPLFKLNN